MGIRKSVAGLGLVLCAVMLPIRAAAQSNEVVEYYGLDQVGSIRVVFDPQGAIKTRRDYAPFGEEITPVTADPKVYAQLFRDEESKQDYAQARMYQPRIGRFTSIDPVYAGGSNPQRWNRYAYALNSPANFVDPDGLHAATFSSTSRPACESFNCELYWQTVMMYQMQLSWDGGGGWSGWRPTGGFVDIAESFGGPGGTTGQPPGGTGTTPTPPTTPTPAPIPTPNPFVDVAEKGADILRCASTTAEGWSLGALIPGVGNGFLREVLGNDFSSYTNLALGPDRAGEVPGITTAVLVDMGYQRLNESRLGPKILLDVRTTPGGTPYAHGSYAPKFGSTTAGSFLKHGVKAALRVKSLYDGATFAAAAVACGF